MKKQMSKKFVIYLTNTHLINKLKMPHSFHKVFIHAIWSTKNRLPLLTVNIKAPVYGFLQNQFEDMDCPVRIINGMPDHVHCLFILNPQEALTKVIKQVKGSTSHFINQQDLISQKFSWQTGHAAYSVSESHLHRVHKYIERQEEHHKKRSFQDEYDEFLKLYGFK